MPHIFSKDFFVLWKLYFYYASRSQRGSACAQAHCCWEPARQENCARGSGRTTLSGRHRGWTGMEFLKRNEEKKTRVFCKLPFPFPFANGFSPRLKMELDLQSLFRLLCTAVLIGWDPPTLPSPRIWAHIQGALLVSQDRQQLFVTPWFSPSCDFLTFEFSTTRWAIMVWCEISSLPCANPKVLQLNFFILFNKINAVLLPENLRAHLQLSV